MSMVRNWAPGVLRTLLNEILAVVMSVVLVATLMRLLPTVMQT